MKVASQNRRVLSVSQLTSRIKSLLENSFPFVWVSGELSNFRVPSSGHFYFTLKDSSAQISAVMFKGQNRNLKFLPEHGMKVLGFGRISLYEPRGSYQIILEYLEPDGIGALQVAFEQLKARLDEEGLFDERNKKKLPLLPRSISIITSPTGAVVHDILNVLDRRYANPGVEILPVKVQGDDAARQIVKAFEIIGKRNTADVVILARGGGSLEDLQAFNEEIVARAIHNCSIPVISAVGHETDFTIADFVADLRAPTPSAAAELAVPVKTEYKELIYNYQKKLQRLVKRFLELRRDRLNDLRKRLKDPRRTIQDARIKVDDQTARLFHTFSGLLKLTREKLERRSDKFYSLSPQQQLMKHKEKLEQHNSNILLYLNLALNKKRFHYRETAARLTALDPQATLKRGYSITRTSPDHRIVNDPVSVNNGQLLEITVAKGPLLARVEKENN